MSEGKRVGSASEECVHMFVYTCVLCAYVEIVLSKACLTSPYLRVSEAKRVGSTRGECVNMFCVNICCACIHRSRSLQSVSYIALLARDRGNTTRKHV